MAWYDTNHVKEDAAKQLSMLKDINEVAKSAREKNNNGWFQQPRY